METVWVNRPRQTTVWYRNDEILCHHGIKGQKWGVRRYQNEDGSLTPLGQKHVDKYEGAIRKDIETKRMAYKEAKRTGTKEERKAAKAEFKDAKKARKEAIKSIVKEYDRENRLSDFADVLTGDSASLQVKGEARRRAAKLIVDHGMEPEAAYRKASRTIAARNLIEIALLSTAAAARSMYTMSKNRQ